MNADQIRELYYAQPFRPFSLQTTDGDRLEVRHPEDRMILLSGRTVVVAKDDTTCKIVDLLHVTAIDFPNGKPASDARK